MSQRIRVLDSHTAGEPTRLVLEGAPDLGTGTMAERLQVFRRDHDTFRSAVVNEPRGFDAMVGALLCEPSRPDCDVGVIFFNNVGYLGMCGHGTIGLVASLAHLGRTPGPVLVDTPVGPVRAELHGDGSVSVHNVPSRLHCAGVQLEVPGLGVVTGDVAYGGNWFFLVHDEKADFDRGTIAELSNRCHAIRAALVAAGVTGANGAEIDHIELCGTSPTGANSRNFVMCPGGEYDRSPCGTGTSARLACLAATGELAPGETWVQESVLGTSFEAHYSLPQPPDGTVLPVITGRAYVTAETTLLLDDEDPLRWGIR